MSAHDNKSAAGPGSIDGPRAEEQHQEEQEDEQEMVLVAVEKRHVAAVEAFIESLRSGERPWAGELEELEKQYLESSGGV